MKSKKVDTEKLGRAADRAVWSLEVAERLRDLVLLTLENHKNRSPDDVRRALESTLGALVESYEKTERETVGVFVDAIQKNLRAEHEASHG